MARDDETDHQDPTTGEETGSSSSSTGRDSPVQEDKAEYSEATIDILDDEEKIALGLMPDPNADPDEGADGDDTAAAADGEDTAEGGEGDDSLEGGEGDDTAEAATGDDSVAAGADDTATTEAKPDVPPAVDDAEVKRLDAEMKQALKDLRDGEITEDEYEEKTTSLQQDRDTAVRELGKVEAARENWHNRWFDAVGSYQKEVPELFQGDHRQRFDAFVRQVTGDQRPEIQSLSMHEKLERAHKLYAADADIYKTTVPDLPGKKKADPKPDSKAQDKGQKQPKDEAQKRAEAAEQAEPPQTLSKMPASATPEDADGRFARLHQLERDADPEKLEAEIMRLKRTDPDAYEAYMESA